MPVIPLPERPDVEQIRKRAKDLLRQVRATEPRALALVAEHAPEIAADSFTLASAQLVVARHHGFPSWPRLRRHLDDLAAMPDRGALTTDNRYRVHRGWADDDDVARCARVATAAHPPARTWRPVLTARHTGVRVVVFSTPDGPLFAELTPTTTTLSPPVPFAPPELVLHTGSGTLAGVVPPGTTRVAVERVVGGWAEESAVVVDGVFVVPNAFTADDGGVVLRVDGEATPVAVPPRAGGVVDRPAPAADRRSPAGRRLAHALEQAAVRPVVDPSCWQPGAHAVLDETESVQLGRYGDLLLSHLTGQLPHVADFGPARGPVRDFAVTGETVALTRLYHGFVDDRSDRVALVGLVEPRVAAVVLRRATGRELPAVLAGGTLVIADPDLTAPRERGPVTERVVTFDAAGNVLEDLPYQR
ncbi:hypothetical protein ACQPYE_28230 [Actinosynnema sp. CA-299493]